MSVFQELKRRNVLRVAAAYVVSAWLLIEVSATLEETLHLPEWADTLLAFFLILGFPLVLFFSWVYEITPEGIRRESEIEVDETRRHLTGRKLDRVLLVLMAVALVYFAVDKFVLTGEDAARPQVAATQEESPAPQATDDLGAGPQATPTQTSIVVLPFVNMSADPDQEYFSDGMTEELLNLLAGIPELRVISRSTAFTFKGKDNVIPEVAAKLDVTHVLEGSVRKAGNQVRITAQLIEGPTDTHLWSETYDRELEDVFAIQDEISAKVVRELRLHLPGMEIQAREIHPEAYEYYLRARHMWEQADTDRIDTMEQLLEQAIEIQPDYLPALWLMAARVINLKGQMEGGYSLEESREMIDGIIERMQAIDPDDSHTNNLLAIRAYETRGEFEAAARYWERVVADDPYEPESSLPFIAGFLSTLERSGEAEALARFIVDRDPACIGCVATLANVLRRTGRHREAAHLLETNFEWHEPWPYLYWQLGVAWLIAGDPQKALDNFEAIDPQVMAGNRRMGRSLALHDLGRMEEFKEIFDDVLADGAQNPEGVARAYAWIGDADRAFEWLEKLVELEGPSMAHLATYDLYVKIHDDPRYMEFLERNGVAPADMSAIEFNPDWPPEIAAVVPPKNAGSESSARENAGSESSARVRHSGT